MVVNKIGNTLSLRGYIVRISREEAYTMMRSIMSQIEDNDPNTHRAEMRTQDGEYFTIIVDQDGEVEHLKRRVNELTSRGIALYKQSWSQEDEE